MRIDSEIVTLLIIAMKLFVPLRANVCGTNRNFNHLALSLQWPTTFVEYNRRGRGNFAQLREHKDNYGYLFTIHGLWPQSGPSSGPINCNHSDAFDLDTVSSIRHISKYWPSFGMATNSFWRYEWNKHGTCAAHLQNLNSIKEYFEFSVEKAKDFDINCIQPLIDSGYKPSNAKKFPTSSFINAIEDRHAHKIDLKCWNRNYISSITICFDLDLRPINCPGQSSCFTGETRLPA